MGSRLQEHEDICYVCGKYIYTNRDKHHIFNSAKRKRSEEDRLYVYCHHTCHMWLHEHPLTIRTFKQRGQKVFEEQIGSRADFIKRYGKSYL